MGWDGRKSLKALILRAPLCGANNRSSQGNAGDHDDRNNGVWGRQEALTYENSEISKIEPICGISCVNLCELA